MQPFCWRLNKKDSNKWTDRVTQHKMLAPSHLLLSSLAMEVMEHTWRWYSHQAWISGSSPHKAMFLSTQSKSKSKHCPCETKSLEGSRPCWSFSREGLKSKALLSIHKLVNYAKFVALMWCWGPRWIHPSPDTVAVFKGASVRQKEMKKYICWF